MYLSCNPKRFHEDNKVSLTNNTTYNTRFIPFMKSSTNQHNEAISCMKMFTHKACLFYRTKGIESVMDVLR